MTRNCSLSIFTVIFNPFHLINMTFILLQLEIHVWMDIYPEDIFIKEVNSFPRAKLEQNCELREQTTILHHLLDKITYQGR